MSEHQPLLATRLHCLDWLRVIAIGVLVFYHIGMVYVPDWGYHFKNPLHDNTIQSFMLLSSPWRMGLLWLISGIAFAHMCEGQHLFKIAMKRTNQILLPLMVGVLFVVPIQLYAQMKQAGDMPLNFSAFVYAMYVEPKDYFVKYTAGIWPRFDVNHLWFLRSLWRFSMVLLILTPVLRSDIFVRSMSILASSLISVLVLFTLPILLIEASLEGEAVREHYGFVVLLLGFCLGRQSAFWHILRQHLRLLCVMSVIAMVALQIGFITIWQSGVYQVNSDLNVLIEGIYAANKILPLLALLALAHRFLNVPNQHISRLSAYVFPLYVLHQSVIILIAYLATNSTFSVLRIAHWQIWFNVLVTPILCAAILFVIARFNWLRVGFGMRLKNREDPYRDWRTRSLVFILCFPIFTSLV